MTDEKSKNTRKMPKKSWRSGRGGLWLIALTLLLSGGIRLTGGTGAAIAKEVADITSKDLQTAEPQSCTSEDDLRLVMDALKQREMKLSEREAEYERQNQALAIARQEIEANLAALSDAEASLSATIARADGAAEADLARLTAVYENMKPKEAALLFEEMAPDFAAGFLGRMRPDVAAAVMAGLSPPAAYSVSVILAGRNAAVPKQ